MSNVEIEIEGPTGNLLTVEGRTEIPLDPSVQPTLILDSIVSTGDEGQILDVTFEDLLLVCKLAPALIAAKEEALIDRFLANLD